MGPASEPHVARVTIGVMARAPVPWRCKTRLAAAIGADRAAEVCRVMLVDTLNAVARAWPSSRRVVMAAPEDDGEARLRAIAPRGWELVAQEGEGLGARLGHALVSLGDRGDAVALVDSDSPTAPWDTAARVLGTLTRPRHACMGPCDDGGYWLIAATTPEIGIFRDIAWSTPEVAAQTRARCRELAIPLQELPTSFDVDDAGDLARLCEELAVDPRRAPATAELLVPR